jgi:phosphotransferase family enzyme
MTSAEESVLLEGGGRTLVHRRGNTVIRNAGPWTPTVHALLRHLEAVGFGGAPRLVGSGFDADGRETLTYIEGEFTQPGPWSLDGAAALGTLLRDLHRAAGSFQPPAESVWFPWHGRDLGGPGTVIGHCDAAPWNIVVRRGLPVALIDWEVAGPVDPLTELAQLCWLNAKLHDDIVAAREGLPPVADRARHRGRLRPERPAAAGVLRPDRRVRRLRYRGGSRPGRRHPRADRSPRRPVGHGLARAFGRVAAAQPATSGGCADDGVLARPARDSAGQPPQRRQFDLLSLAA